MSKIEQELILAHDKELQNWLGNILSNDDLYNDPSDPFTWCQLRIRDLNDCAGKLGLKGKILDARKQSYDKARTAEIIELPVFEPAANEAAPPLLATG